MNQQYYVIEKNGEYYNAYWNLFYSFPILYTYDMLDKVKNWADLVKGNVKIANVSVQDFDENSNIRANQKSLDKFGND